MTALKKLARDPLLHFLVAGGLLFAVFRALHGPETTASADDRTILVDRPVLLKFMQYRATAFQPEYFDAQLAAMSSQEKRRLVDEYVREEALVREATSMGLADGDYVIRRRMAQKMYYLMDDTVTQSFAPGEAPLQEYFLAHQDRYHVAPTMTFTHVFVDNEIKRQESAEAVAQRLKRELESRNAGFDDAPAYGDRFPYLKNCVKRTPDFIESQFGADFTAALAGLAPSSHWQGPIKSSYGYHLVLLTQRAAAYLPKLADIRDEVKDDLLRDTIAAYREAAINDLTRRFRVRLDAIQPGPAATQATEAKHLSRAVAPQATAAGAEGR